MKCVNIFFPLCEYIHLGEQERAKSGPVPTSQIYDK